MTFLLAMVFVLTLTLAPGTPAAAATLTITLDPNWGKTNNMRVDTTIGQSLPPADASWGGFNGTASFVWNGDNSNVSNNPFTPPGSPYYWAEWPHLAPNFTHLWFRTQIYAIAPLLQSVRLVDKYNNNAFDILSINDNLYVYVNQTLRASGGTGGLPPPFVPAVFNSTVAPATEWYLPNGLLLPGSYLTGSNNVTILGEDGAVRGGMAHPVFKMTYTQVTMGPVLPALDCNPEGNDHTVSVTITPAVANVPVVFVITGANLQEPEIRYTTVSGGVASASLTYRGIYAGMDSISTFIDLDGDRTWDESTEPHSSASATKYWLGNYVTGGGIIKGDDSKSLWSFAGNAGFTPVSSPGMDTPAGQFEIVDHANKTPYHFDTFERLVFFGSDALTPPAYNNMIRFRTAGTNIKDQSTARAFVTIADIGKESDKADQISVYQWVGPEVGGQWVWWFGGKLDGLDSFDIDHIPLLSAPIIGGLLNGGNFQVHNEDP
ncbi:MAG: hypothetical protein PHU08_02880, partial [Dehalococcoidales bacterium]|nr:hypothetical protein [Dehalococcoidales bacterium]